MILHYLRHEHQYVAGLASVPTFAARICRHRLSNLYATETACKRRASGDDLVERGDRHRAIRRNL
jgi:hypothetical protein